MAEWGWTAWDAKDARIAELEDELGTAEERICTLVSQRDELEAELKLAIRDLDGFGDEDYITMLGSERDVLAHKLEKAEAELEDRDWDAYNAQVRRAKKAEAELTALMVKSRAWGKLMNKLMDERDEFVAMLKQAIQDSEQYYCGQTYEDIFAELRECVKDTPGGRYQGFLD